MSLFKHYFNLFFSKLFKDKRDKTNTIILFEAEKILTKMIDIEIKKIQDTNIFELLSTYYEKEYLKSYFAKKLKEISTIHQHKLFIINYDKNFGKKFFKTNNNKIFRLLKFLHLFKNIYTFYLQNLKLLLKKISKNYTKKNKIKIKSVNTYDPKIGICFVEGINTNRRSDIYWLKGSKIRDEDIIFYGHNIPKKINEKTLHKLSNVKNNFNFLELENFNFSKLSCKSKKIIKKIKILKSKNIDEIWLKNISLALVKKINYWENFFNKFNIKIHMDHSENNAELFCKQIAINSNNGLSLGKMRSYPMRSFFNNYYPNNIFFVYGNDSYSQFKKTKNPIKNFIISGYPYNIPKIKLDLDNIFHKTLTILILDNNYGLNDGAYWQNIYTPYLKSLYFKLFEKLINDDKISIIIKPKKYNLIPLNKVIIEKAKKTKRLKIIEDGRGFMPISLVPYTDIVVSTGVFLSGSMMECVALNAKAVFCDYANIEREIPHLYKQGFKKIIFQDIDEMIK